MANLNGDPLDRAMGNAIRARRKQSGLSQSVVAQGLGLTFQQIQKYERGANRVSFSALVKIARVLNCRVADLVNDLQLEEGDAAERGVINAWLGEPGAMALLESFHNIRSKSVRKAVVDLARKLSVADE